MKQLYNLTILWMLLTPTSYLQCMEPAARNEMETSGQVEKPNNLIAQPVPTSVKAIQANSSIMPAPQETKPSWGSWLTTNVYDPSQGLHGGWLSSAPEEDEPSLDMQEAATQKAGENNANAELIAQQAIQQSTQKVLPAETPPANDGFDIQINTPYLDAITKAATPVTNYVGQAASNGLIYADGAAKKIIENIDQAGDQLHQTISSIPKKIINPAVRSGAQYLKKMLTDPTDPNEPAFFEPETNQALGDLFNTSTQVLVKTVGDTAQQSTEQNAAQASLESNPYGFTKETQDEINKAAVKLTDAGVYHTTNAVHSLFNPTEDTVTSPEETPEITSGYPQNFEEPMLNTQDNAIASKSTATTSTVTGYLTNMLKKSAQAIQNSPKDLVTFVQKTISTFSQIVGLSKEDTAKLQTEGTKQVNLLVTDKTSWFYATGQDFDSKFNTWIQSMVTSFNKLVGKNNPTDITIIQTEPENTDPGTPKITINYNKVNSAKTTAQVEYKGYTYTVDPTQIKFDKTTSTYTITTDLNTQPTSLGVWDSMIHNTTIKNTVTSLKKSLAANTPGFENIDKLQNALLVNPTPSDGELNIVFNTKTTTITTTANTTGQAITPPAQETAQEQEINTSDKATQDQESNIAPASIKKGTIVSIKNYKNNVDVLQMITLDGPTSDIFAPTIKIQYNPNSLNETSMPSITIQHTNKQTKKQSAITIEPSEINFDTTTGIYTINTTRLNENQPVPKFGAGLTDTVLSTISNPQLKKSMTPRLQQFETQLATMPQEELTNLLNNLDKGYIPAMLKNIAPDVYTAIIDFILKPLPTSIAKVTIEFNPSTNQVATRVIKTMSDDTVQKSEIEYAIS